MLIANESWIFVTQVVITIAVLLWSYDRYAKRRDTALGRFSVEGAYTRVDYIAGEFPHVLISYSYTVDGKSYFGSISQSILSISFSSNIEEHVEATKKEYLAGRTVKVFYYQESPSEHWINAPPSQELVLIKAAGIPLLILILSNVPLLFIDYLITASPFA
ncbi:MAG: DUF3592 domain-containing protein [Porticoccaceae bacterium]